MAHHLTAGSIRSFLVEGLAQSPSATQVLVEAAVFSLVDRMTFNRLLSCQCDHRVGVDSFSLKVTVLKFLRRYRRNIKVRAFEK